MNHVSRVAATFPRETAQAPPAPLRPQALKQQNPWVKWRFSWENHTKTMGK